MTSPATTSTTGAGIPAWRKTATASKVGGGHATKRSVVGPSSRKRLAHGSGHGLLLSLSWARQAGWRAAARCSARSQRPPVVGQPPRHRSPVQVLQQRDRHPARGVQCLPGLGRGERLRQPGQHPRRRGVRSRSEHQFRADPQQQSRPAPPRRSPCGPARARAGGASGARNGLAASSARSERTASATGAGSSSWDPAAGFRGRRR